MAFDLRLTTAGLAALADGDNAGSAAVTFSHLALGDGSGPGGAADDARVALRSERNRAAVVGSDAIDRRIALRATFMPATAYEVTEVGLYGSVSGGATTLYGYWSDSGAVVAQTASGTSTVIAATLDFIAAAADVAVTVDASIQIGGDVIPATTARRGAIELATIAEGRTDDAERAVTPLVMGIVVDEKIASSTQDVASAAGLAAAVQSQGLLEAAQMQLSERVTTVEGDTQSAQMQLSGRVTAVEDDTRSATTNRSGIVELATDDEGIAGDDDARAMTAHSTRAAASATVASLLGSIPEDGTKYALQGAAGGALTLVQLAIVAFAVGGMGWVYYDDVDDVLNGGILGDDVSIDGASSWTIPASGPHTIMFSMDKPTNVLSRGELTGVLYRQPIAGVAGKLSGQGVVQGGFAGSTWCGELSQGDVITVRFAGLEFASSDPTFSDLAGGRYRCLGLCIMRQNI